MDDKTHEIAALVKERVEELGLNLSQVSLALGRNRAYIHQFINRGIPARLPGKVREQLAKILQIDEKLLAPSGTRLTTPARLNRIPSDNGNYRMDAEHNDIPVLGTAFGSDKASDFSFNGDVIDYIRCPPALTRAKGCFAIRVVGTSMVPRFEPGNIVIVQTGRIPSVNDYVVIELEGQDGAPGPGFIKRLIAYSTEHIVCEQFNPAQKLEFKMRDIKTLYRVVSSDELLGVSFS
jgi:phage repressor protein C with HTH and peptisase S24 domain